MQATTNFMKVILIETSIQISTIRAISRKTFIKWAKRNDFGFLCFSSAISQN